MGEVKTSTGPMEELKELLFAIKGGQDIVKEQQEQAKESMARLEEKVGKHDEVLTRLEQEGVPTTRKPEERNLPIPGTDKTTRVLFGYNVDLLGRDLQNLARHSDPWGYLKGYSTIADDDKKEAFAEYMVTAIKACRGNRIAQEKMEQWQAKTNMTEGTDATVGYLVNDEYANEILAFARLTSVALRDCRIMPMGTDVKKIPAESSSVSVDWKTEAEAVAVTNPVVAQVTLTAKKLGAYAVCTNELLEDSAFDVVSWLSSQFAEALGQEIDNEVFQGDGTGSGVSGLTTAACGYSVTLAGSISTITGTKLSEMITKLGPNKRAGAKFYVNKAVFHYIRTLKDANNAFIYNSIAGPQANTIWGYPVQEVEQMPSTDGTGKPILVLGNLQNMIIGRRTQNTTFAVDPYGSFLEFMTRFRMLWRIAISIGLSTAFVRMLTA